LANISFSCANEEKDNQRMKDVYKGEMPHFLESINPHSSDQRLAVPEDTVFKLAECLIDDMEKEENKWWNQ
jgi:hypothetical protein